MIDYEIDWSKINNFVPEEFDDPDYPGSGHYIDPVILFKLEILRDTTGWAIIPHWKVGGCVDVTGSHGHSNESYHCKGKGYKAVDFHFKTKANPRIQYYMVEQQQFTGLGLYYDWKWADKLLPIGFHVDDRPLERYQRWVRVNGIYNYLLK